MKDTGTFVALCCFVVGASFLAAASQPNTAQGIVAGALVFSAGMAVNLFCWLRSQ